MKKDLTIVGGSALYEYFMHMKGLMRQKYEIFRVQNILDLQYYPLQLHRGESMRP